MDAPSTPSGRPPPLFSGTPSPPPAGCIWPGPRSFPKVSSAPGCSPLFSGSTCPRLPICHPKLPLTTPPFPRRTCPRSRPPSGRDATPRPGPAGPQAAHAPPALTPRGPDWAFVPGAANVVAFLRVPAERLPAPGRAWDPPGGADGWRAPPCARGRGRSALRRGAALLGARLAGSAGHAGGGAGACALGGAGACAAGRSPLVKSRPLSLACQRLWRPRIPTRTRHTSTFEAGAASAFCSVWRGPIVSREPVRTRSAAGRCTLG